MIVTTSNLFSTNANEAMQCESVVLFLKYFVLNTVDHCSYIVLHMIMWQGLQKYMGTQIGLLFQTFFILAIICMPLTFGNRLIHLCRECLILMLFLFPEELIPYPRLWLLLWLLASVAVLGIIYSNGSKYVNYPRLNQRQSDKEKLLWQQRWNEYIVWLVNLFI